MKRLGLGLIAVLAIVALVGCGEVGDVGSSSYALVPDAGCTNGNCPPAPDAGCSNGNCPPAPDAGCSNGNCPPAPDAGCSNGNCPAPPDAGCSNGNCPTFDGGHHPPPWPVCCVPVANMTQHLCCGYVDNIVTCRLSTIPDHVVIHDVLMYPKSWCVPVAKQKKCKTLYCRPEWWPRGAEDVVFPPEAQCGFWDSIRKCKGKGFLKKFIN